MARLVIGTSKAATTAGMVKEVKPAHYIEKTVDANGALIPGNTFIDLTGVTSLSANTLSSAYSALKPNYSILDSDPVYNYPPFDNIDIDLTGITLGVSSIHQLCTGRTGINNVRLTVDAGVNIGTASFALTDVKTAVLYGAIQHSLYGFFYKCLSLTSLSSPEATEARGSFLCNGCSGDTSLKTASFPLLQTIGNNSYDTPFSRCFEGCTALETVDLSKVRAVTGNYSTSDPGVFYYAFKDCTSLTTVKLDSLTSLGSGYNYARTMFYGTFYGCTALRKMKFQSLTTVGSYAAPYLFYNCTALEEVWFYALTTLTDQKSLYSMLRGCTGVTLHFPKNKQATWESYEQFTTGFNGTDTVILFDIITSLTGADTNTYARQEKDSTSTATAWVRSNTLYYTSGTTEPQVGDTIYSDAACTTSVTTVTAIA